MLSAEVTDIHQQSQDRGKVGRVNFATGVTDWRMAVAEEWIGSIFHHTVAKMHVAEMILCGQDGIFKPFTRESHMGKVELDLEVVHFRPEGFDKFDAFTRWAIEKVASDAAIEGFERDNHAVFLGLGTYPSTTVGESRLGSPAIVFSGVRAGCNREVPCTNGTGNTDLVHQYHADQGLLVVAE